jgi:hypothetical protein
MRIFLKTIGNPNIKSHHQPKYLMLFILKQVNVIVIIGEYITKSLYVIACKYYVVDLGYPSKYGF